MMSAEQFDPETGEIFPSTPASAPAPKPKRSRANGKAKNPDETKRQKFVRLVDPRVAKALLAVRRIGKLGGRNASHYEYSEADVEKIIAVLTKEIAQLEKTMIRGRPPAPTFSILD